MKDVIICCTAMYFAVARQLGVHTNLFKDGAHVFMGLLIGGAIFDKAHRRLHLATLGFLIVVEFICFKVSGRPLVLGNP